MAEADDFDTIADLPDDGSRQKEVYSRYGLAMYWAQVFEEGMANLIVTVTAYLSRTGNPLTSAEIDELYEDLRAHTAGKLVNKVKEVLDDPEHIDECRRAVMERNRLAHGFFRDHDQDFMTAAGMQRILEDADAARLLFQRADEGSTQMVRDTFALVGIGEDMIEAEFDALLRAAHERDGQAPAQEPAHRPRSDPADFIP